MHISHKRNEIRYHYVCIQYIKLYIKIYVLSKETLEIDILYLLYSK